MNQVLIICGPTATGKTDLALELGTKLNGELVSADSRQVYVGNDLVYGKDLPSGAKAIESLLIWRGKKLKYYQLNGVNVWLYDVITPSEAFSVSQWRECAQIVISDVLSRQKLPIIVGGTGLYIKSLTHPLREVDIKPNHKLRKKLQNLSVGELFDYLKQVDPKRAKTLNDSDRMNSRRLIRSIEISQSHNALKSAIENKFDFLQIGLTAPLSYLLSRVDQRVTERISQGAEKENRDLARNPNKWMQLEHKILKSQITWFKKHPHIRWFDISQPGWKRALSSLVKNWYN